jgi:transposase-like protein
MTVSQMKVPMNAHQAVAVMEEVLQGVGRATEDASSIVAPDPEVAATAKRRQFSPSERRRILSAADRCHKNGEIGALLRREGIYSSQLATWRKRREANEHAALTPHKRGPKTDPAIAETRRVAELTKDNERLRRKLAQAHTIIDVQKKLCTLLGLPTAEDSQEES